MSTISSNFWPILTSMSTPANSDSSEYRIASTGSKRPQAAIRLSLKLSFGNAGLLRISLLRSCRWRTHQSGHQPPVMVTFRFQEAGHAPIRLSGRFTATNLNPALARPGHFLPFEKATGERTSGGHSMRLDFVATLGYRPAMTGALRDLPLFLYCISIQQWQDCQAMTRLRDSCRLQLKRTLLLTARFRL